MNTHESMALCASDRLRMEGHNVDTFLNAARLERPFRSNETCIVRIYVHVCVHIYIYICTCELVYVYTILNAGRLESLFQSKDTCFRV